MHISAEEEQRFWSNVWQCTHRHPCKKCCWPWGSIDMMLNWKCVWSLHGTHMLAVEGKRCSFPAHRLAYILVYGLIPFSSHRFHVCHQCYFAPCCNPRHLAMGGAGDNAHDRRKAAKSRPSISLPDGRIWTYQEACDNEAYFEETLMYQRVWAGNIPKARRRRAQYPLSDWHCPTPLARALEAQRALSPSRYQQDFAALWHIVYLMAQHYGMSVVRLCMLLQEYGHHAR